MSKSSSQVDSGKEHGSTYLFIYCFIYLLRDFFKGFLQQNDKYMQDCMFGFVV